MFSLNGTNDSKGKGRVEGYRKITPQSLTNMHLMETSYPAVGALHFKIKFNLIELKEAIN